MENINVNVIGDVIKSNKIIFDVEHGTYFTVMLLKSYEYQILVTCTDFVNGKEITPSLIAYHKANDINEAEKLYQQEIEYCGNTEK